MVHAQLPDLILSDIDMPEKGVQHLCWEMRADPALASRQLVLMTGKSGLAISEHAWTSEPTISR